MHFNGSGDTRKGVCLCMSVAELMEKIGVNEVLMWGVASAQVEVSYSSASR